MLRAASLSEIQALWEHRWSLPILSPWGSYQPQDVEGLVLEEEGELAALVTWAPHRPQVEIVSLDAVHPGCGHGSIVLAAVERLLKLDGFDEIELITSNDNLRAVGFYVRRGYRLVRVHVDAMTEVRRIKPDIPLTGLDGIPLRDVLELRKRL